MTTQMTQLQRRTRSQSGFSLVELLIVVAVILIIAAIAIPNFIRSKMRANEAAAVENLRTITTADTIYLTTYGIGFASTLPKLGGNQVIVDANGAGLIDSVLSIGVKNGYSYTYNCTAMDNANNCVGYSVNADPLTVGATGDRFFFVDQSAIVRFNTTTTAAATDAAI